MTHSTLPDTVRHQLHTINRRQAWFSREPLSLRGMEVPADVRRLARSIMRHVMSRRRRPNLPRLAPRLDSRIATIAEATKAKAAPLWASFKVVGQPGRIHVPLHPSEYACPEGTPQGAKARGGQRSNTLLLCTNPYGLSVRLVQDMSLPFAASRAAYAPRMECLGVDFRLSTLLASSRGDRMGRGVIVDLIRLDRQITGIARHRMREMLRTRINAALNRLVVVHSPAELVVERLDFCSPDLSRRMNPLVQNCGRASFRAKLADLGERFGIEAAEVASPYTSQECASCGYVDRRNRLSQSEFRCRFCGSRKHADVNAGRVITRRRSAGLDAASRGCRNGTPQGVKAAILAELVRRFCARRLWRRITASTSKGQYF